MTLPLRAGGIVAIAPDEGERSSPMAVAFQQSQTLGRSDLDIFITNAAGNPSNCYSMLFGIYYVDPATSVEVIIGSDSRAPVNPAVGEYYASLMVPASAVPGDYRVRWTFKELSTSPEQQVVQEFAVVSSSVSTTASTMSACQADLVRKLRFMIRDNCVGGEETVELDVGGKRMVVRMDDLWEVLHD